jgi:hypothetical protein
LKSRSTFIWIVMLVFASAVGLVSCTSGQNGAVNAIEAYIQALSDKDEVQISNLSCADWEKEAILEVDSMTAVGSNVEDLSCHQAGQEEGVAYVTCSGVLALDYNGEAQEIDLSARTFIARQEGGIWRMCGYR